MLPAMVQVVLEPLGVALDGVYPVSMALVLEELASLAMEERGQAVSPTWVLTAVQVWEEAVLELAEDLVLAVVPFPEVAQEWEEGEVLEVLAVEVTQVWEAAEVFLALVQAAHGNNPI